MSLPGPKILVGVAFALLAGATVIAFFAGVPLPILDGSVSDVAIFFEGAEDVIDDPEETGNGVSEDRVDTSDEDIPGLDTAEECNEIAFDGEEDQYFQIHGQSQIASISDSERDSILEITFSPAGDFYGASMEYFMTENHGNQPEAAHARAWIRFPEDWQFADEGLGGTKMAGFTGTYQTHNPDDVRTAGWGGRESDGTNGWSTRPFVARPDRSDHADEEQIGIGTQVYHAADDGPHGDHPTWEAALTPGEWHQIDQYIEMNTPGEADGRYQTWVDGEPALEMDDLHMRDEGYEHIAINEFWMNFYFGGDWGTPVEQSLYYDDLEICVWETRP